MLTSIIPIRTAANTDFAVETETASWELYTYDTVAQSPIAATIRVFGVHKFPAAVRPQFR